MRDRSKKLWRRLKDVLGSGRRTRHVWSALLIVALAAGACDDGADVAIDEGTLEIGEGQQDRIEIADDLPAEGSEPAPELLFAPASASPAPDAPALCTQIAQAGAVLRSNSAIQGLFGERSDVARQLLVSAAEELETISDDGARARELTAASGALRGLSIADDPADVRDLAGPIVALGDALNDCGFEVEA